MEPMFNLMKKRRPSLGECGVKPLTREMHEYLVSSYILMPVIVAFGHITTNVNYAACVLFGFLVLGFLLYNMLVAFVQMSHDEKKRLLISQGIFCSTLLILVLRIGWVLS